MEQRWAAWDCDSNADFDGMVVCASKPVVTSASAKVDFVGTRIGQIMIPSEYPQIPMALSSAIRW